MNLTPTQQRTLQHLEDMLPDRGVFVLWAPTGFGKSTMLADLQERLGGRLVQLQDVLNRMENKHPLAMEDVILEMLTHALGSDELVLVDDIDALNHVLGSCAFNYPRRGALDAVLKVICTQVINEHLKIVFACNGNAPQPIHQRCTYVGFRRFELEDYKFMAASVLGEQAATAVDCEKINRFAPHLSGHQLHTAFSTLKRGGKLDADTMIDVLMRSGLASNVNLSDVEPVDLADLKGVDAVLQGLEAHVVVPFERPELAEQFDLHPKKGVLLYGPPGTGKTTIGRALAHRLKGKFFLIDGDFVSDSEEFFPKVRKVFDAARQNAPSVVFIDDSDVIFENENGAAFYRYLLTLLDGVENDTEGMVCVMMTAMDAAKLPAALIRSGRIELWLEMPLPGATARRQIIDHWTARLPEVMRNVDADMLVEKTDTFTGADLRLLFDDAKNLYAYDIANSKQPQPPTEYLVRAVGMVAENRDRRAQAEANCKPTPMRMPFPFGVPPVEEELPPN